MSLYLAVDAGGTKADYVLADAGPHPRPRAFRNHQAHAHRRPQRHLCPHFEAFSELEARQRQISASCCHPHLHRHRRPKASRSLSTFCVRPSNLSVGGHLQIIGDVEIALDAAFPGECGVLVLAGTGSNVAARSNSSVSLATFGGWGPALADQGSGHRIGYTAHARRLPRNRSCPTLIARALQSLKHSAFHQSKPSLRSPTRSPHRIRPSSYP